MAAVTAPLPVLTTEQQETTGTLSIRDRSAPRGVAGVADAPDVAGLTGLTGLTGLAGLAAGRSRGVGVSATLAANEELDERRRRGERVLPLAFGEAGVPVARVLRNALATASHLGGYGPVAGAAELRAAAAGYWTRRGLATSPEDVVCGPGSKALLYGLLLSLQGGDVAIPRPSWVSYAAQAALTGIRPVYVPIAGGEGGVPDPDLLSAAVTAARRAGRRIGAVIVTLPDNPTGTLATSGTVRALCAVARQHDLLIISDEIYRDLTHASLPGPGAGSLPGSPAGSPAFSPGGSPAESAAGGSADREFVSPADVAPERTVITSGLSKNLALGGWRLGVARLPGAFPALGALRDRLLGTCSEIWSAPAAPVQHAAALAFGEPPEITERVARSRHLHAAIARAVAARFTAAGAGVPAPRGAFYLYPDFAAHRQVLHGRFGVRTSADLAALLLRGHGIGVLPGSAFGDPEKALRLRVATSRLYGEAEWQQEAALAVDDPAALPWIADSLAWLDDALAAITR